MTPKPLDIEYNVQPQRQASVRVHFSRELLQYPEARPIVERLAGEAFERLQEEHSK